MRPWSREPARSEDVRNGHNGPLQRRLDALAAQMERRYPLPPPEPVDPYALYLRYVREHAKAHGWTDAEIEQGLAEATPEEAAAGFEAFKAELRAYLFEHRDEIKASAIAAVNRGHW
jgi:hypothetical protein